MSKKNRKQQITEIPRVGNALEVPNYVTPTTDLEYKQTVEQTRSGDCRDRKDCRDAEDCRH